MPPTSVTDVLQRLDSIIDHGRRANSRLAYFAVLYRLVTRALMEAAAGSRFDDPARVERLTTVFAGRYLEAFDAFARNASTPLCWSEAFRATIQWRATVIQHLLLGVNAHINFDLGIAVVRVAPGEELPGMRHDFDLVNDILGGLIDRVEQALTRIYPALRLVDALGGRTDEAILDFSLRAARASAWLTAERLNVLDAGGQRSEMDRVDRQAKSLALVILRPGLKLTLALLAVRAQERGNVASLIDRLDGAPELNAYFNELRASAT